MIAMKLMHLLAPQNFSTKKNKRKGILKGLALSVFSAPMPLHSQFPRFQNF